MIVPVICLIAYLLGSIPFGPILARFARHNKSRTVVGKVLAFITIALNALKGAMAVLVAMLVSIFALGEKDIGQRRAAFLSDYEFLRPLFENILFSEIQIACLAALFALLGHMYPVWLKFRGGKGIAITHGIWLPLYPMAFLVMTGVWLVGTFVSRKLSIGALASVTILPVVVVADNVTAHFFLKHEYSTILQAALATMTLVIWQHRGNIGRIIAGTEPKIGKTI